MAKQSKITNIPFSKAYCELLEKVRTCCKTSYQLELLSKLLENDFKFKKYDYNFHTPGSVPGKAERRDFDLGDGVTHENYFVKVLEVVVHKNPLVIKYYAYDCIEVYYDKCSDLQMLGPVLVYLNKILPVALEQVKKSEKVINEHREQFKNW